MQYFYKSYRQDTEASLKSFDAEFSEPLDKEGRKLKQVNYQAVQSLIQLKYSSTS